jgi:hypothetical protein
MARSGIEFNFGADSQSCFHGLVDATDKKIDISGI